VRNPNLLVLDQTEELYRQVERVTEALRPRPNVVWYDSFGAIEEMAADAGPFDVLIAGPLVSEEGGFQHLRRLRAQSSDTRLILAVDRWPSESVRDTVRIGALDILRLPVRDAELLEAVEQALRMAPAPPLKPAAEPRSANSGGTVIAVVSATGGCGKTFFATNLGYHLHSRFRKETCLIDLDMQFGELSTALRLRPRYTISDLVSDDVDGDDLVQRLEEHLVHHDSGIHLLAAPNDPAEADSIEASDVIRVIEAARSRFDYVVIDTPAALSEPVLAILDDVDQIFALATLDLPSVRNLGILLGTLTKLRVPTARVQLLLNKVEPDVGIDVAGVSKYFPQGFSMIIPYGREVNRSLNMGQPVLAFAPQGSVSRALDAGLSQTLRLTAQDEAGTDARHPLNWWRRVFGRQTPRPA